jgi:long-chain acyl-CoA synthetase
MIGVLRAGMVVVNMNLLYTPYEMGYQLQNANAKAIITLTNFAYNLEKILSTTPIQTIILTQVGDLLGPEGHIINFAIQHIQKFLPTLYLILYPSKKHSS